MRITHSLIQKLLFAALLTAGFSLRAQPPAGYYNSAAGLYGTALQQALHNIIDNHTSISYSALWGAFESTDKKSNGKVWDIYSDVPGGTPSYEFTFGSDQCGSYNSEGDCFNREHSFPASWFDDNAPMYSDLFQLYPTDGYVNNRRSNYPFAKVNSATWTSENGCKLGSCATSGYSGTVFEPIDAYKGDLARTYFYMATRYYGEDSGWPGSGMVNGSQMKPWAKTMLLQWSAQDPVSQKEINRNNAIYAIQHNRNPFIDNPEYALSIWGTNAGVEDHESVVLNIYPNPVVTDCTISLPEMSAQEKPLVLVYNITGAQVQIPSDYYQEGIKLDFNNAVKGIYFVNLQYSESGKSYHARIIHQ